MHQGAPLRVLEGRLFHLKIPCAERRLEPRHRVLAFKAFTVGDDHALGGHRKESLKAPPHGGLIFDGRGEEPAARELLVGAAGSKDEPINQPARLKDMKDDIREHERTAWAMKDGPFGDARRALKRDPFERRLVDLFINQKVAALERRLLLFEAARCDDARLGEAFERRLKVKMMEEVWRDEIADLAKRAQLFYLFIFLSSARSKEREIDWRDERVDSAFKLEQIGRASCRER